MLNSEHEVIICDIKLRGGTKRLRNNKEDGLSLTQAYTSRLLKRMQDKKVVEVEGTNRSRRYIVK